MNALTDKQLTHLEHRAQISAGSEMSITAAAVADMVAEIRQLRAALAQRQQVEQRMGDWLERMLNSDAPPDELRQRPPLLTASTGRRDPAMNHQQLIDNWARAQLNNTEAWLAELAAAKARVADLERTAAEYVQQMATMLQRAEQAEALNEALRERCELLSRAATALWQLLSEEHRQLLSVAINAATISNPEPADS